MTPDVVVTGVGAVTPLGTTAPATWAAARAGESGVAHITRFDPDAANLRSQIAGEVDFDSTAHADVDGRSMGRYAQYAVAAATEAIADAGLRPDAETEAAWPAERVGVGIGSGFGGLPEIEAAVDTRPSPRFTLTCLPNLAAGHVSEVCQAQGPVRAPATACAAGTHAIGDAVDDIRLDRADVMLAGGTEAGISPLGVRGFDVMRALSTRNDDPTAASRPFDAARDGFVIAEGAAVLVLEARDHAVARGVTPVVAVTGHGRAADAYHPTRPPDDAHGLRHAMQTALADAGRAPADVDHVNAHATGTPDGDPHEATALSAVFETPPPVTAPKSVMGHALGASGAIEALLAVETIREEVLPPTATYETPDPECDIPVVREARETDVNIVLSNSAGFGGANGTLIFERTEEANGACV